MRTIYITLLRLSAILLAVSLQSQTSSTTFTLSSPSISINGEQINIDSELIVGPEAFSWIQIVDGVAKSKDYTVSLYTDEWNPETSIGSISLNLSSNELIGTLVVTGTANGITASLSLTHPDQGLEVFQFFINGISYH